MSALLFVPWRQLQAFCVIDVQTLSIPPACQPDGDARCTSRTGPIPTPTPTCSAARPLLLCTDLVTSLTCVGQRHEVNRQIACPATFWLVAARVPCPREQADSRGVKECLAGDVQTIRAVWCSVFSPPLIILAIYQFVEIQTVSFQHRVSCFL